MDKEKPNHWDVLSILIEKNNAINRRDKIIKTLINSKWFVKSDEFDEVVNLINEIAIDECHHLSWNI